MRNALQLTVIENLVAKPELRSSAADVPVARFTVASTPRTFDREVNAWQDGGSTFLDCHAWRQLAANLAQSLFKGVVVAGRLRADRWESPEGDNRSRMVLDVDDVGASTTFATVAITWAEHPAAPLQQTAPDDPWATASPVRLMGPAPQTASEDRRPL